MNFIIEKKILLKPLQKLNNLLSIHNEDYISGNILLKIKNKNLLLISTNLEIELLAILPCNKVYETGNIIIPGKKFLNVIRSFPINSEIQISTNQNKMKIIYKKIYFSLTTSEEKKFPEFKEEKKKNDIYIKQKKFKKIISNTQFAMAKQDVRNYMNGMCLEFDNNKVTSITTDGYRMAVAYTYIQQSISYRYIIIPQKTIIELIKILSDTDIFCKIIIGKKIIQIYTNEYIISSKLIDSEFPDYKSILVKNFNKEIKINRTKLQEALKRACILTHKQLQGVKINFNNKKCIITTHNEYEEQIREEFSINCNDNNIELTMNINFLLDVINTIKHDYIKILLNNSVNSIYIKDTKKNHSFYIIMPLII